jgi:hypothetical protein
MWTAAIGAGVVAGAGFLPWARSGRTPRSSFDLARLADRLDLVGARWQELLLAIWITVPLLAALGLLGAALDRPRPALVAAGLASVLGTIAVVLATRTPLPLLYGVWVTLAGAVVGIGGITSLGWRLVRLKVTGPA